MSDDSSNNGFKMNANLAQFYEASLSPVELLSEERYINEEFIAEGAIKRVYKVTDTHCSRTIALARIKHELINLEHSIDFIREVQITSGFEHPNIIRVYNIGISHGAPWFTMELTSGRTLVDKLKEETKLTLNKKLEIFRDICDAIQYAHARDVLHLDLKPENVSIGKEGQILLGDWGIASSIAQSVEGDLAKAQTQYGYIKGSPGFMAPEQAYEGYQKHPTADVFGLGALLFYILTSEAPIMGDSPTVALTSTRLGQIKSLERKDIPPRLVHVLAKALALRPQNRYQHVAELKREIDQYLDGFATSAESANFTTQLHLFVRRHMAACISAILLFILLPASTIYYISSVKISEKEALKAKTEALKAKEEAQIHLAKFVEEQEARQKERRDSSLVFQRHSTYNLHNFNLDQALESAQDAVANDPENENALYRLGFLHFMRQDFKEANKYLKYGQHKDADLMKLAAKYAPLNRKLTGSETVHLFNQIQDRRAFLKYCMFLYDSKIKSTQEHLTLVKFFLEKENKVKPINISWNQKNLTLTLTGNPKLKTIYTRKTSFAKATNLLSNIPAKKVLLDDTGKNRKNIKNLLPNKNCKPTFVPLSTVASEK
ncbi:protein kinase domain-containing protein [Rubritalea tangerina]|uniref:Protein kinase n=1 Tax=Rubritalea tangerina TaxID=430798 RepID=A0ABW4ZA04_9BACT